MRPALYSFHRTSSYCARVTHQHYVIRTSGINGIVHIMVHDIIDSQYNIMVRKLVGSLSIIFYVKCQFLQYKSTIDEEQVEVKKELERRSTLEYEMEQSPILSPHYPANNEC